MVVGAYAIAASKGFIYLRGEYKYMVKDLRKKIDELKGRNLIGEDICREKGFCFDVDIRLGSGSYVCGEETALIESLESKRGSPGTSPRIRPRKASSGSRR